LDHAQGACFERMRSFYALIDSLNMPHLVLFIVYSECFLRS
jgi:hypothetical protein